MKKQTLYHIAVSVLFLFIGRLPASALSPEYLMTIQVPFEFQVNEKVLPAGKYLIKRDPQAPLLLLIQCPKQNVWVTVHTIPHSQSGPPNQTSLMFQSYGEQHFLTEVRVAGYENGYALIKSKDEQRLAQIEKAKGSRAIPNSATMNN